MNRNGFRIGIPFGIGIEAHPLTDAIIIRMLTAITANLRLFLNFKVSTLDLYDLSFNQGFRKVFPGTLQDP